MEILKVDEQSKKERLDVYLTNKRQDLTRSFIKTLIDNGFITVNDKKVKAGYKLLKDDIIKLDIPRLQPSEILPENIDIDIVYEDDDVVVINKAQGMVVHPAGKLKSGTLVNALLYHIKDLSGINGKIRPGIVHRIDKDTSGLIVVAKNNFSHINLQKQIQNKSCQRIYLAVTFGKFKNESGEIKNYLARSKTNYEKFCVVPNNLGRFAQTNYKVLAYNNGFSLVKFQLKTGRTHQIRVHSLYLGHPIVGDKLYGNVEKVVNKKFDYIKGQLLHAYKITFVHPRTQQILTFTCPLPEYFEKFLKDNDLEVSL